MKVTVGEVKRLEYRKERLREKISLLEQAVSGRDISLLPLMRTKAGNYSEAKTRRLVEDLVDAWRSCRQYDQMWQREDGCPLTGSVGAGGPSEEEAYYRSLLYCALRLLEHFPDWVPYDPRRSGETGTFQGLLSLTGMALEGREQIFSGETMALPGDGFQEYLGWCYGALRGKDLRAALPSEEFRAILEKYGVESPNASGLTEEEEEELLRQATEADAALGLWETEEGEPGEDWEAVWREKWVKSFPHPEAFCQAYEAYWRCSLAPWRREQMPREVERMVDLYLYQHGLSAYLEDDLFFYAHALMDKVARQVQEKRKAGPG